MLSVKSRTYGGFYYANEFYADNIHIFRKYLSGSQDCRMDGWDAESVKRQLAFLVNFPPDIPHNRLVAHRVEISAVRNPVWQKKGKLLVPKGDLENVLSLDFGSYILKICDEELSMREYLENMTVDLGDGTVIEGIRIKKSNYHGASNRRTIPNEHLNITYDSSMYAVKKEFDYHFEIKRDSITTEQPKEFHIQEYVMVDGVKVEEQKEVVKSAFNQFLNKWKPEELKPEAFSHFVFSAKKLKYFLQFDPKFLVTH